MGIGNIFGTLPPLPDFLFLVENLVFKDQQIQLDGYRFKNCAFVNCILETKAGNFKIEECFFQGNWWAQFGGTAERVVKLTSILDWNSIAPGLRAVVHPNGGVTIS